MTLPLTHRALMTVGANVKEPNIVFEIEGLNQLFGALIIKTDARIGDTDLEIGDPEIDADAFYIGGLSAIEDQDDAITMDGTTTSIRQMLQIDIGQGSSISNMQIALIDKGAITQLITPGEVLDDILQARCKVYLGFSDVSWPEDYVVIFRGVITDVDADAGKIILSLSHPDDKKQGSIFKKVQPKLSGAIDGSTTTITLDSVTDILTKVAGPDGSYDPSFENYIIIDNEVILFTGISGNTLTGVVRAQFGSDNVAHDDGSDVQTLYRLNGNCVDLALKLMASTGDGSPYLTGKNPTNIGNVDGTTVANVLWFERTNLVEKYNVQIGDFVTITGASNGANNVTLKEIVDIIDTDEGQYLAIDGVTFVEELATAAVVSFRSQYDTLPDGLALINDEIDFDEHLNLQTLFLGDFSYDFRLKDTIDDCRKFLEEQVYSPVAAFSLPRKSRCSIGYHIGPIPGQDIKVFDKTNIKNPSKMRLKRSTNRQFYNEIVYKFDESMFQDGFNSGVVTISEDSKAQIKGYNKALVVEAKGLRSSNSGLNVARSQSNRRLQRYQFAAEVLSFSTTFAAGFNVEIGDIVWIDGTDLYMPDIKTGLKGMAGRYFFVQNKTLSFKGDITFDCIDTNFAGVGRYGLMSPSSIITSGVSKTEFIIGESYSHRFGTAEHKKWRNLVGATVRVRTVDGSLNAETILRDVSSNSFVVAPELPWIPSADMIVELTIYPDQALESANLVYAAMSDSDFPDGKKQFVQL